MTILALSALQANFASALGLGNLSIKSALNQPLNAEIKLLDAGDLDPTQIKIQLGSPEDFQRSGVDRDYFLTNLRFSVAMDGHGGGTIRISTKEPVVEPYLNFVIEARWPNGRLLREFAVLLDPPTFSAGKGAGSIAPASTAAQPARKAAVQPPTVTSETQAARTVPEADMSLPGSGKSGEYRVQVYDTLSKIAARYKPASDVSVAQTMLAIQRANPDAFINNNINLIKSGAIVRLPSADDARAIPGAQAAQEAEEQTHAWRSGSARPSGTGAVASGPQLDASAPEPGKSEGGYREKARLSIAAPGGSDKATAGEGSGASGKGTEALREQLTASQEALEKGKRDNRELQSRLDDMERQIATLQRLISLKDDQLAALQAPAGDKTTASKPAQPEAAPATTPPAAATPQPEAAAAPAASTPQPAAEQPAAAPAKPAPAKPVAVPQPAPEPSLWQQLTANPLYLGGAAAALLAILGTVLLKRRRDEEGDSADDDFTLDDNDTFRFGADTESTLPGDDAPIADSDSHIGEAIEPGPSADAPKKTLRPETGDAIAESDIYIAYGRYQQAVDLLSNAIEAEPNRSDLRVKLLEVYVEMRNRDAFRQQFAKLQELGDGNAVAQVKDMLSSVDGVSDWLDGLSGGSTSAFATTAAAATATAAAAFAADALKDEFAEKEAEPEIPEDAPAAEEDFGDDLGLDLDLDAPASAAPSFDNSFGLPADSVAGRDLEFSLDLDADTAAASSQELSDLSLDFDNTPPQTPASNFDFAGGDSSIDEGLELDLGDDDLDQMLGELGGGDALSDLEEVAGTAPGENPDWQPAPAPAADLGWQPEPAPGAEPEWQPEPTPEEPLELSEEFDLSNAAEDLSSGSDDEIDVFAGLEQALPAAPELNPADLDIIEPAAAPTLDSGDDFDFLSDSDEVATKLDLARAYIDMGDTDGARDILDEVLQDGTDNQKQEASSLLSRIG